MDAPNQELAGDLIHTLLQVLKQFRCIFRHQDQTNLAPGHFRILTYLVHHQPNLRQLAERAMVTPATMSRTVDALEEHGWLVRRQNPEDRRQVIISLTDQGYQLISDIHQAVASTLAERMASFSDEEKQALADGLGVLSKLFLALPVDFEKDRSNS